MCKKFNVLCVLLICSIGVFSGCFGQPRPAGMPPLHPTTVLITQEGRPLANAIVSAISTTGSQWSAVGATDNTGRAKLFVNGQYDGVPEGSFKLLVTKIEEEVIPVVAPVGQEPDPRTNRPEWLQWNQMNRAPAKVPNSFDVVEAVYSRAETTPLMIDVIRGKNEFTFDVGKVVRVQRSR